MTARIAEPQITDLRTGIRALFAAGHTVEAVYETVTGTPVDTAGSGAGLSRMRLLRMIKAAWEFERLTDAVYTNLAAMPEPMRSRVVTDAVYRSIADALADFESRLEHDPEKALEAMERIVRITEFLARDDCKGSWPVWVHQGDARPAHGPHRRTRKNSE